MSATTVNSDAAAERFVLCVQRYLAGDPGIRCGIPYHTTSIQYGIGFAVCLPVLDVTVTVTVILSKKRNKRAFVRRGVRSGFYSANSPTVAELVCDSDDNLLKSSQ